MVLFNISPFDILKRLFIDVLWTRKKNCQRRRGRGCVHWYQQALDSCAHWASQSVWMIVMQFFPRTWHFLPVFIVKSYYAMISTDQIKCQTITLLGVVDLSNGHRQFSQIVSFEAANSQIVIIDTINNSYNTQTSWIWLRFGWISKGLCGQGRITDSMHNTVQHSTTCLSRATIR